MKNRTLLALALALALFALIPAAARGGAWTQPEGEAYVRLAGGLLSTDQRFDRDGNKVDFNETTETRYEDFAVTLYTEVGLEERVTLIGDVAWKSVTADAADEDTSTTGFADAGIGLKVRLGQWDTTVASLAALVTFPTGYDADRYPALGSDATEVTFSAQVGDAAPRSWINVEAYFKFRGGDFRHQVGGGLTMGVDILRQVGLRGEARGGLPTGEASELRTAQVDPADFDPSFFDLAGTLSWKLPTGFAIELEARRTIGGRNTLHATRFNVALATTPSLRLWEPSPR